MKFEAIRDNRINPVTPKLGPQILIEIAIVLFAVITAQVTPGPNMMAVASSSLGSGRKAGLITAMGISVGVFLWAVAFTTGGGAFIAAFPETVTAMKLVGGAYLLFLAFTAVRRAFRRSYISHETVPSDTWWKNSFFKGLFVVSTNPKAALVWIAVSAYLAPLSLNFTQYILFGLSVAATAFITFGGYALLFSEPSVVRQYQRFHRYADTAFGAAFGAIGSKLVWDGARDLRV